MLRPGEISGRVFPCPPAVPESSLSSGLSSLVDDEQGPCLHLGLTRSARESAGLELTAPEGYPVGPKGGAWRQHRTHVGPLGLESLSRVLARGLCLQRSQEPGEPGRGWHTL